MMTVHSGVRQGADVETWSGTEMQESQAPETGGSTIGTGTSLRKRSNPTSGWNGAMICCDTVTLSERVKRWTNYYGRICEMCSTRLKTQAI